MPARYAELHALSNFTFLRGASQPEELVATAATLGYEALAITDECSMSGVVRAHMAAKDCGLKKLVIGSLQRTEEDGIALYQAVRLVLPLGSTAGWEAAVFDHFKALVATIIRRLPEKSIPPSLADSVGGSTYTFSVWPGHPMADEVYGTLKRFRSELSAMRDRAAKINDEEGVPEAHTRTVIYVGQSLIGEGSDPHEADD
jgi:hypothetical protein